jgi:hypothetical protein
MRGFIAGCVAVVLAGSAALADPAGKYDVAGTNPGGGSTYSGTVTVQKTGDTYKVTWNIGGTQYVGTAIANDEFISVSYVSGSNTGLALFGAEGDDWKGIWTYAGGTKVGTEAWTKK